MRTGRTAYTTKEFSPDTWADFERLFEGHCACFCMYWQRPPGGKRDKMPVGGWGVKNKREKEALVRQGRSHGIIVYDGETPVGWCQYGSREETPRIEGGREYGRLSLPKPAKKLWRISCFFVDKKHQNKGVARAALRAALESIRRQGGGIVEAFPYVGPKWDWDYWGHFGTHGMFEKEHFKPVTAYGRHYMVMRREL